MISPQMKRAPLLDDWEPPHGKSSKGKVPCLKRWTFSVSQGTSQLWHLQETWPPLNHSLPSRHGVQAHMHAHTLAPSGGSIGSDTSPSESETCREERANRKHPYLQKLERQVNLSRYSGRISGIARSLFFQESSR